MVIEAGVVAGYLIAWAVRKAKRVGGRLDRESDAVIDAGLDRLHEVVAVKLAGHPALAELVEEAEAAGDGGQLDDDVRQQVELALKVAAKKDDAFGQAVTELVAWLQAAGAAGSHSQIFNGNIEVKSGNGGISVFQGDVHIGPSPETLRHLSERLSGTWHGVEELVDRARQDRADRADRADRTRREPAHAAGRAVDLYPVPVPQPVPGDDEAWRGGAEVPVGDRQYLLHDGLLAEQADLGHSVLRREALARQLIPKPAQGARYAWLRQAGPARGRGNAAVQAAREALARERDLLEQAAAVKAVPRVAQLEAGGGWTTLAVTWPVTRHGEPCPTLGASFPPGRPPDRWHLHQLLTGIGGLATALSRLHSRGVTHRNLTPDAIIVTGDGRFTLRDLGLAGQPPRLDEGLPGYQAPEQQPGGGTAKPGPATDVWQLAAVTYQLVTGHRPALRYPAPAHALNQDLPESLNGLLAVALEDNPADRPPMSGFRLANRLGEPCPCGW